jgi:hypothetical protein
MGERLGIFDLDRVELDEHATRGLAALASTSLGSPVWKARKAAEARSLLALAHIAPRMQVLAMDASAALLAIVRLRVPVACLPPGLRSQTGRAELVIADHADLALRYPEELLRVPLPGYALVQVLEPRDVWHPNCSTDGSQRLCLGAKLPRGYPLREAVLTSYSALCLAAVTLDELDPAGVLNAEAARWWQAHATRIPLSRAAFLDPEERA